MEWTLSKSHKINTAQLTDVVFDTQSIGKAFSAFFELDKGESTIVDAKKRKE